MVLRILDRIEEHLAAGLLAAITLLTFCQVVLRYVFDTGLIWALEATTYLFGWLVLIGMSIGVRANRHIAVDLLLAVLPGRARRIAVLLAIALSLLYAVLMLYGSVTLVSQLRAFGSLAHDIPLPRWLLLMSLPVGFALLSLRIIQVGIGVVRGTSDGIGAPDDGSARLIEEAERGR
jgi:C4-dicarboxylate transporter DctQ subunit